ncbi:MAG: hypothetical protein CML13_15830 [Puniceicoccaceae bacterium]|nr:hypothetical protein [Puniceicoccaceae bacterium]|tara:strand:- start:8875 stop:9264 length:390 start_codon:yes stop_codon:yes gene_type:complete
MPDFNANGPAIIQLLVGAGCLLWIFNQVMVALGKRKNEQPFIISMEKRFVSQEEHKEHVDEVKGKLITAARSRKDMHEEIKDLDKRTCRIEEQNKSQTDSIALLSSDAREFYHDQRAINNEILKRLPKS